MTPVRAYLPRLHSFAVKLALAALIFAVVPVLLYERFSVAEDQRNALMLRLVQEQGRLAGEAVFPLLDQFSPRNAGALNQAVKRLAEDGLSIKVLFRPPTTTGSGNFLLVASAPETSPQEGRAAMDRLASTGVLTHLNASCEGKAPLALRLPLGSDTDEGGDLLTYLTPHATANGCWVVLAAQPTGTLAGQAIGRPYWQAPEVQVAAAIYLVMAVLILSIFTDAWRNLRRFRDVARAMVQGRDETSFATSIHVPELAEVAWEFDAMVATLRRSEALLRQAAEENAHALKAPLAVISQSMEPLRRAVPPDNVRGQRALEVIIQSIERLDGLVSTARRIDEIIAGLIERPRRRLDLSALMGRLGGGYVRLAAGRSITLSLRLASGLVVAGDGDMVEIIAENLLDNALDFAPPGSMVTMELKSEAGQAQLRVTDHGPGVAEGELDRIFHRHLSRRPDSQGTTTEHYGLGLWIVRRNAEAMGGRAWASRNPAGGLTVTVSLPLAP